MRYLEAKARKGPPQNKLALPTVETKEPEAPQLEPEAEAEAPEEAVESDAPEFDATPAAAGLADEHGIDLADVTGTGSGGRITVGDVRALIEGAE